MTKFFLALLLLLTATVSAYAAADPAVEAMETLRRGFAGTNDFTADITQEKQLALMKKKMVSKGVVRFKKPDTFFMELLPPHPSRLLLKDNVMTMRLPEQAVTEKVVLPPEEGLKKWFAFLGKPITTLPEGVAIKAERRGKLWNVQIFPKSKGAVRQLTLTFDAEGKISRIVIDEHNKDQTILSFKNVRRNIGLQERDLKAE
ncbi:outer membrane lipoprotein carrier protein LolA [Geomonas sp.]|uniref:outer membrane lipoprotein carrier protein LolA n=1 Tax=Geomonas sp. TaxID=2651584 RepID=UPI002B4775DA|nr:outer membrane lipoprotein carrier protein LolA [Geomonas sp.]HJV36273.1 outer membrane lipoprotein carrier protein LolA [Geomonas sp.]